jgi:serine/threonine protein kinase
MPAPILPSLLGGALTECERITKPAMFNAQLFKAKHAEYGNVFCKIIPELPDEDENSRAQHYITGEIEAGRKLKGPHVRRLLFDREVDEVAELYWGRSNFLVFEWVEHTLDQVLTAGIPAPVQCLRLAHAIARALGEAHELLPPIFHRDVKPQNVLVEQYEDLLTAKLADFGISRMAGVARVTTTYAGSQLYMAPEQFKADSDPSAPTDVYALALLLWQAMTGTVPLVGDNVTDLIVLRSKPTLPTLVVDGRECRELTAIFRWALASKPEGRPPSTLKFAQGLGHAGIKDGLWTISDLASASESVSANINIPKIILPPNAGRDERSTGGMLELYLPASFAGVIERVTGDIDWTFNLLRSTWSTSSPLVTVEHVQRVLESREARTEGSGDHRTTSARVDRLVGSMLGPRVTAKPVVTAREARPTAPPPVATTAKARFLPSPPLAAIVGPDPQQRHEIANKIWRYIYDQELKIEDEDVIRTDEALRAMCDGRETLTSDELLRYIRKNISDA